MVIPNVNWKPPQQSQPKGSSPGLSQKAKFWIWAGIGAVLILIIGGACSGGSSQSPAQQAANRISAAAIGTVVNDGTTMTKAQCDPSTVQNWGDGSVSASCNDTFSDGTTATQTLDLLGSVITIQ